MAQEVSTVKTVVEPVDMFDSLVREYVAQTGVVPTRAQILLLLAQWALETGNGKSENNYNPGGIKHVSGDGQDWTSYTTTEVINGSTQTLTQTFAAYPTLDAGTKAYLSLLQAHYPNAWAAVVSGSADTTAFAQGLKDGGYYTAPVQNTVGADGSPIPGYAPGLASRLTQMASAVPISESLTPTWAWPLSPVQTAVVVGAAGFLGWTYYTGDLQRFARKIKVPRLPAIRVPRFA